MRILVIDSSPELRQLLIRDLEKAGHVVQTAADGRTGLDLAGRRSFEAVILDPVLPDLADFDVLRQLRDSESNVHVLVVSAAQRVEDGVRALHLGADDYLAKPFHCDELRARLEASARRGSRPDPRIELDDVTLDTRRRCLCRGDEVIALTPTEYSILELLACRRGQIVPKQHILEYLSSRGRPTTTNVVEVLIHNIRKKLRHRGVSNLIRTRRGYGYFIS